MSFREMTDGNAKKKIDKINCACLPPCRDTLNQHIKRANFVSLLWSRAESINPSDGLDPLEYGWQLDDNNHHVPIWYTLHR